MTREEAISEWTFRSNYIKKWLDEYGEEPSIRHYVELIDMAIEALSEPQTDLISRANAIRWVKTECNQYGKPTLDYDSGLKVIEHLKKMPSELPSAEAVQGEWIHDGQNFKGGLDWCHCSVCGQKTSTSGLSMYNFCPNCGAKMKGGAE